MALEPGRIILRLVVVGGWRWYGVPVDVVEHLRRVGFGVVLVMVVAYLAVSLWRQRRRGRHRSGVN